MTARTKVGSRKAVITDYRDAKGDLCFAWKEPETGRCAGYFYTIEAAAASVQARLGADCQITRNLVHIS